MKLGIEREIYKLEAQRIKLEGDKSLPNTLFLVLFSGLSVMNQRCRKNKKYIAAFVRENFAKNSGKE